MEFKFPQLLIFVLVSFFSSVASGQKLNLDTFNMSNTAVFTTNVFYSVGVGKGGQIWAGTSQQGLYKNNGSIWVKSTALTNHVINDIKTDRDSGIWVAQSGSTGAQAVNGGINYFSGVTDNNTYYGGTPGLQNSPLPSRNARSVFIDTTRYNGPSFLPVIWSAHFSQLTAGISQSGGVGKGLNPASPTFNIIRSHIETTNGLGAVQSLGGSNKEIWAFAPNNYGRNEILVYNPSGVVIDSFDYKKAGSDYLPSNFQAKAIYIDKYDRKWLGMLTGGVVVYDGAWHKINFPALFQSSAFVNNNAITGDENGKVFIGTNNGLIVYDGGRVDDEKSYKLYNTTNGLPSINIRSICVDKKRNRILLATDSGIVIWKVEDEPSVKLLNPYPSLVNDDGYLSTSPKLLDTTKIVKGLATDGVSKLILYLKSSDGFTFKIADSPKDSSNGTLSYFDNEFRKYDSVRAFPNEKDTIVAVIFNSPDGFGSQYTLSGGRDVFIKIDGVNDTSKHYIAKIRLMTPPVVMVHGMWSKPDVWNTPKDNNTLAFAPYLTKAGFQNIKFADYQKDNFRTFDPENVESIFGRSAVYKAIRDGIDQYERDGILAAQVDVVGHSLGGLMTRSFAQWKTINFSKRNYKHGYVHKLITLGTPHSGSPFGPALYNNYNEVRLGPALELGAARVLSLPEIMKFMQQPIGSCHRDFNPIVAQNSALLHLKPTYETKINKVHAVIGINEQSLSDYGYAFMSALCRVAFDKSYSDVFNNDPTTDLIVKAKSQLGGLDANSAFVSTYLNTGHSYPATITETNNPSIYQKVKSLLQTNAKDFFADFFPAPVSAGNGRVANAIRVTSSTNIKGFANGTEYIKIKDISRDVVVQRNSGKEIEIAFDALGGAKVTDAVCMIQELGWYVFPNTAPYSIKVLVPDSSFLAGKLNYVILARDTTGIILGDTSYLKILPSGNFTKLELNTDVTVLDSVLREVSLRPFAFFGNPSYVSKYDVSDTSTGTKYLSMFNRVKIDGKGIVSALSPGIDTVTVTYSTESIKVAIRVENSALVNKQMNTISFDITDKKFSDILFPLTATSLGGEAVKYELISGPVELNNGIVTIKGTGTVTIKASTDGNAYFQAPSDVARSFDIVKGDQSIIFDSIVNKSVNDTVVLKAVATSSLPVTYLLVSGPAILKRDTLLLMGPGAVTVRTLQMGNENYNPANSVDRTFNVGSVLPLTLLNFSAQLLNKKTYLNWETNTDDNLLEFFVQRNVVPSNFTDIGQLPAVKSGTTTRNYSFIDVSPNPGANYYRLKIIDERGKISYSKVIALTIDKNKTRSIIFPNPVSLYLNVQLSGFSGRVSLKLVDILGRTLKGEQLTVNGTTSVTLDTHTLTTGTYSLLITSSDKNETLYFMKK